MRRKKVIPLINIQKAAGQHHARTDGVGIRDVHRAPQYRVYKPVAKRAIDPIRIAWDREILPPIKAVNGLLGRQVMINVYADVCLQI